MDRKQLAQSIKRYAKESILDIWGKISPDNERIREAGDKGEAFTTTPTLTRYTATINTSNTQSAE